MQETESRLDSLAHAGPSKVAATEALHLSYIGSSHRVPVLRVFQSPVIG